MGDQAMPTPLERLIHRPDQWPKLLRLWPVEIDVHIALADHHADVVARRDVLRDLVKGVVAASLANPHRNNRIATKQRVRKAFPGIAPAQIAAVFIFAGRSTGTVHCQTLGPVSSNPKRAADDDRAKGARRAAEKAHGRITSLGLWRGENSAALWCRDPQPAC